MNDLFMHLKAVLQTTPNRWHDLTATFPEALLRRRPADGEWSAIECLQHLIDIEAIFTQRVHAFLAGADFPAFFPDEEGSSLSDTISAQALATQFSTLRQKTIELIDGLDESDLERKAVHAELGRVTLSNMLHEWGGHDLMHLVQAEQALMQPFIDGCGAWQVYFAKHHAKAT